MGLAGAPLQAQSQQVSLPSQGSAQTPSQWRRHNWSSPLLRGLATLTVSHTWLDPDPGPSKSPESYSPLVGGRHLP